MKPIKKNSPGIIFAIEGIESSGKTSLFRGLQERLRNNAPAFFPEIAEMISSRYALGISANQDSEMVFLCHRSIQFNEINNCISEGRNVVLDRCWISQIVYSKTRSIMNRNYSFNPCLFEIMEKVLSRMYPLVLTNTVIIYLDIPPETALERIRNSDQNQKWKPHSEIEWLSSSYGLYREYLSQVSPQAYRGIEFINGDANRDEILSKFLLHYKDYVVS